MHNFEFKPEVQTTKASQPKLTELSKLKPKKNIPSTMNVVKSTNIKKFKELLAEHFEKIHPAKSYLTSSYSERPTFLDSHPFKSMLSANHVL